MDDIKPGLVIQLNGDERECLKGVNQQKEIAWTAFMLAAQAYKRVEEEVIGFIRETHPELEGFEFSINHETGRVKVLGRK